MRNTSSSHAGTPGNRFSAPPTPGRADGLGERWWAVAGSDGSPVELLHLRNEVSTTPGFEEALRECVAKVKRFTHPAFAPVRDLYQEDADLALVSVRVSGQPLAELTPRDLPRSKRPAIVARILQQTTGALAALERSAPGVTHGALTADRIFVTPGGAVCITEYVFGPALDQLALWPEELFLQFGLLAPAGEDGQAAFHARTTVMQLGAVALSVLLERPVTLHDFDHRLDALVEEFVTNASAARTPSLLITPLRTWLRRALQLDAPGYTSASEAENGLTQALAAAGPGARAESDAAPLPLTTPTRLAARDDAKPATISDAAPPPSVTPPSSTAPSLTAPPVTTSSAAPVVAPAVTPSAATPSSVTPRPETPPSAAAPSVAAPSVPAPSVATPSVLSSPSTTSANPVKAFAREAPFPTPQTFDPPPAPFVPAPAPSVETSDSPAPPYLKWVIAALAVVAVGEGAFLARLLTRNQPPPAQASVTIESAQPGTTVMVDGRPAGTTPLKLAVTDQTRAIRLMPSEGPAATPPPPAPATAANSEAEKTAAALEQAAARQKSGGVTFVSPIPLDVFEGERVLGSTSSGPIVASAGAHTLDLVNTSLGFRVRQAVTIRAGTIARVPITPPMGRLSINAQPWAQVSIDDTAVGETPLANVPATLGEHQITFRHPQFGERRERVIVRADAPARVSTTFQR